MNKEEAQCPTCGSIVAPHQIQEKGLPIGGFLLGVAVAAFIMWAVARFLMGG